MRKYFNIKSSQRSTPTLLISTKTIKKTKNKIVEKKSKNLPLSLLRKPDIYSEAKN